MLRGNLGGRELGGEWVHVCVWLESLCCPPETITTSLIGYTPVQDKKNFSLKYLIKWKKKTKKTQQKFIYIHHEPQSCKFPLLTQASVCLFLPQPYFFKCLPGIL